MSLINIKNPSIEFDKNLCKINEEKFFKDSGNNTNFIYSLSKRISPEQIDLINKERFFAKKFELFDSFGVSFDFEKVESSKFNINLQTIDFNFPKVLADILLLYYSNSDSSKNSIKNFVSEITRKNEFNYDLNLNSDIYNMTMKRFLAEYALGMRAGSVWKRDYQADGGYLIVRNDGEIICYHFYFVKNFETYLFENTKLETPDPNRYQMAEVYEENDVQKIRLNLQIRFTT